MKTSKNKKKNTFKSLKITKHFFERFNERVMVNSKKVKSYGQIKSIIKKRLDERERVALDMFHKANEVELPMGQHVLVIKRSNLITIY